MAHRIGHLDPRPTLPALGWQQIKDTMLVEASQPLATHTPCYSLVEVMANDYYEMLLDYRD